MLAELHCHTSEYSACSHVNAIELIQKAYSVGLQTIVITDHHYQWNDNDLTEIKRKSGVPDIFNVLAGQEFKTSDYGDVLIYGVKETIKKSPVTLEEIRKKYPEAAIIWAHPYRHNHIPSKDKLLNPLHNGIEIFSSNYTVGESARALKDYHELKFTAIAGTDTHALSYTGTYPTIFDHPFSTIEEMAEEIKAGRCRPYFKEIPRTGTTDTKITEIVIGPKSSEERKKIIAKTYEDSEAWEEGKRSHLIAKKIQRYGFTKGTYRISTPLEEDEKNMSLYEEHVSGEILYEKLIKSDSTNAKRYLTLAAEWLAELHNMNLKISPPDEYLKIEEDRLNYYLNGMYKNNHPHTERAQMILDQVWKYERELINSSIDDLVQSHGDFHPKNIFIGIDDKTKDEYVAVIDLNSSFQLPRAFDVGTFLAQLKNMFIDKPSVTVKTPADLFLDHYIQKSNNIPENFLAQVNLYKARTFLSVIYYLVKVGLGDSENFWTILVDAEKSLAQIAYSKLK